MLRTRNLVTPVLALLAGAAAALAGPGPIPLCSFPSNGDFSLGFAFWSPDVEVGEFGITSTNALISADPLGFLPNNGNIATFFTEASADYDCRTPNGSAASSTVVLSRTILSATAPVLRFQYGAQYSYLVTRNGVVEYTISVILTNRSTGKMYKCTLSRGSKRSAVGEEGIIQVPLTTWTSCNCLGNGIIAVGNEVEIEVVFSVRADGDPVDSISFIGGPGYADNFQFCNIICLSTPIDPVPLGNQLGEPVIVSRPLTDLNLADDLTPDELRAAVLDADGDGKVTFDDLTLRAEANGVIDMTSDAGVNFDLDADGFIGPDDITAMLIILESPKQAGAIRADFNGDGVVDALDLEALLGAVR